MPLDAKRRLWYRLTVRGSTLLHRIKLPASQLVIALGCATAISCSNDRATEPSTQSVDVAGTGCAAECALALDLGPLRAARFQADSASVPVPLASMTVKGAQGTVVSLKLFTTSPVLEATRDIRVLVDRDGQTRAFTLTDLARGTAIYTFASAGDVSLRYSLKRRGPEHLPAQSLRLVQKLDGSAQVLSSERPWAREPRADLTASCFVSAPVTTICDNTVTTSPYVAGSAVGGTFTSKSNTSASDPITVTFANPVQSVSVTIYDADFGGNQIIATGGGSASFSFDNQPGNGGVIETQTVSASSGSGITSVQLIPAAADYVAYDLGWEPLASINVDCTPNPVERGQQVTCTASPKDQSATLTVTQWKFEGPEVTSAIVEQSSSLTWAGKAVTAGAVTVQGTVNGASGSGKGNFTVSPRPWSAAAGDTVAFSEQELPQQQDILPDHPTQYPDLGNQNGLTGAFLPTNGYEQVPSGPNKDVFYWTKVPIQAISQISLNRVAMAVGSDFYNLQGTKPKNQPGSPVPYCVRADVPAFLPKAINHEGLGSPPPAQSHTAVFRDQLNQLVPAAVEDVVSLGDLSGLQSKASTAAQPAINTALQVSDDAPPNGGGTVPAIPVSCDFKFYHP